LYIAVYYREEKEKKKKIREREVMVNSGKIDGW